MPRNASRFRTGWRPQLHLHFVRTASVLSRGHSEHGGCLARAAHLPNGRHELFSPSPIPHSCPDG
eukprot:2867165-Alexandrium_andersonii.AAC.1